MSDNTEATKAFLSYLKWASQGANADIKELDVYIQGKVKDLIQKFQVIAKNALAQEEKTKSAGEKEGTLTVGGRKLTYSEATLEMKRLMDSLMGDGASMTYERKILSKKVDEMTRALFSYTESSKEFTDDTKESIESIKKSVIEIVTAFQFQDFVTQRITHITSVFDCMDQEMQVLEKQLGVQADVASIPDPMINNLLEKFFLSKVKENFIERLDPEKAKALKVTIEDDDEDDGIELF